LAKQRRTKEELRYLHTLLRHVITDTVQGVLCLADVFDNAASLYLPLQKANEGFWMDGNLTTRTGGRLHCFRNTNTDDNLAGRMLETSRCNLYSFSTKSILGALQHMSRSTMQLRASQAQPPSPTSSLTSSPFPSFPQRLKHRLRFTISPLRFSTQF